MRNWRRFLLAGLVMAAPAGPAAAAPSAQLIARVSAAVDADAPRLTAIFKDLHQHPELAFTETRTAGIVAKELKALGFEVTDGDRQDRRRRRAQERSRADRSGFAPTWMRTRCWRRPACPGPRPRRSACADGSESRRDARLRP